MDDDVWTVTRLGLAFFFIFSAFNSQAYIEIAVLRNLSETGDFGLSPNSGYYSFCIIYFSFTIANLLTPPIIAKFGAKWSMVIGCLCYSFFLIAFLHLNSWLLYSLSALLGVGAALLWTGNGVYLVKFSRGQHMTRNSVIMWTMFQSSLVAGAAFLAIVLLRGDLVSSYRFIYGVFFALCFLGFLVLLTLPNDIKMMEEAEPLLGEEPAQLPTSLQEEFVSTFTLLMSRKMGIFTFISGFLGIMGSYLGGIYTACISATTRLSGSNEAVIAFNVLAMGVAEIICGFFLSFLAQSQRINSSSKFDRKTITLIGSIMIIVVCILSFLNLPVESTMRKTNEIGIIEPSLLLSLLTAFCLGVADSCWQTQTLNILGDTYKGKEATPAFALFRFFQAMSAGVAFLYGSLLSLHWQLLIISITSILAFAAFDQFEYWRLQERADLGEIVDD
ncbi:unnamed protein product, partial [Mesorhabditis belari]|uniref:UNC93-like protein MFSD11 n=1 Tax=Mesorhabditis belari TaxID=2138241 RepID=A0AAF3EEN7_9BILA